MSQYLGHPVPLPDTISEQIPTIRLEPQPAHEQPDWHDWEAVPEVFLSRWSSIATLMASLPNVGPQRLAMLGYPSPRAALRVAVRCPWLSSLALISPVPGYAERVRALAERVRPNLPLVSLRRDAAASALRGAGFRTVLSRIPLALGGDLSLLAKRLDPLLHEMLRIGTPDARFLVHATVQMDVACDSRMAAGIGRCIGDRLQWFGLRDAHLGAYAIGGGSRSAEVIGWAKRIGG